MLELTHPNELKYEYREPGYWIIHNPFSSGIDEYVKKVESSEYIAAKTRAHNNPFLVVPTENDLDTKNVAYNLLKPFYENVVGKSNRPSIGEGYMGWLNKYVKSDLKCRKTAGLPHNDCCDLVEGIVANYWMCENIEQSSTKFYKFKGDYYKEPYTDWNLFFDFTHPKSPKYDTYVKLLKTDCSIFPNPEDDLLNYFGYEYEGEAPAEPWKMTIYEFKRPHTAYIPESIDYRLSSCFLYGLIPHPWFRDL